MLWLPSPLLRLCKFLTAAALWGTYWALTVILILFMAPSSAQTAPLCSPLFLEASNSIVPIAMNPIYKGEDKGTYIDPLTKEPWKVKYYSADERKAFEVSIHEGRLVHEDGKKADTPFDPDSMSFEHHLLVIDQQLRIFILPYEQRGRFHHSSLSAGENILFAGTLGIHQGIVRELSDKSGHYRPDPQQTLKVLKLLQSRGLDLNQTQLYGYVAQDIGKSHILTPGQLKKHLESLPLIRDHHQVPTAP